MASNININNLLNFKGFNSIMMQFSIKTCWLIPMFHINYLYYLHIFSNGLLIDFCFQDWLKQEKICGKEYHHGQIWNESRV